MQAERRRSGPKRAQGARPEQPAPDPAGVLLVDKPAGITSHDVVERLRRTFGWRKVGHAGTLDPIGTGVLVILVGRATRAQEHFINDDKEYRFRMRFGLETTTHDLDGEMVRELPGPLAIERQSLEAVLAEFRGEIEQLPPMVSALKHRGKPLYKYARRGVEIPREPRRITVHALELLEFQGREAELRIACSKGTYVRTLAHDIGQRLGVGACLTALRRTRSGAFTEADLYPLERLCELRPEEVFYLLKPVSEALAARDTAREPPLRSPR
ncbi:MAG: hypothetical protein KatS3mg102_1644 [Planctomycetota bacterium]|nr:MAG: hypothetical protein KatS3mg102_1644 [Planctomycetota bacterium]